MDESDGLHHDEWIEINPATGQVIEKYNVYKPSDRSNRATIEDNGFSTELRTMSGEIFTGGPDEYWLWLVARKH